MSATGTPGTGAGGTGRVVRTTVADISRMYADGTRIPTVTAFDYPSARLADEAGIPLILVGDSLAQVILGYETTVRISLDEMLHHTRAVVRGARRAIVVGDMPFLSYATPVDALAAAGRFLREGGAQAVKVEGGRRTAPVVEHLVRNGVPVMGHIGLTPQAIHAIGKVRVQGKTKDQARALMSDALAIAEAGAFAIVLELIPEQLAAAITDRLRIPTIGIGSGPGCSGQIQLYTDLLGLSIDHLPRHSRRYMSLRESIADALRQYASDVEEGSFPGEAESVRMDDEVLDEVLGRTHADRATDDLSGSGVIPLDRDL
jgi:3-methyl-2-oxobutanoate hydroxymethyltransferase